MLLSAIEIKKLQLSIGEGNCDGIVTGLHCPVPG